MENSKLGHVVCYFVFVSSLLFLGWPFKIDCLNNKYKIYDIFYRLFLYQPAPKSLLVSNESQLEKSFIRLRAIYVISQPFPM